MKAILFIRNSFGLAALFTCAFISLSHASQSAPGRLLVGIGLASVACAIAILLNDGPTLRP